MTCQGQLCAPSDPKAIPWLVSRAQSRTEDTHLRPMAEACVGQGVSPSNIQGSEGAPRTMIYRDGKLQKDTCGCQGAIRFYLIKGERDEGGCIGFL